MALVRTANGGNHRGVARRGEPVVNRRPDATALDWRIARPVMAGNQQQHPVASSNRTVEGMIDRGPSGIERHPMEIEHAVRLH